MVTAAGHIAKFFHPSLCNWRNYGFKGALPESGWLALNACETLRRICCLATSAADAARAHSNPKSPESRLSGGPVRAAEPSLTYSLPDASYSDVSVDWSFITAAQF